MVVASVLVACGGSSGGEESKDAGTILNDSLKAYQAANSFHLSGTMQQGSDSYSLDLQVVRPNNVFGDVSVNGQPVSVLSQGNRVFLKGRSYLERLGGQHLVSLVGDRWLLYPASDLVGALTQLVAPQGTWFSGGQASLSKQGDAQVGGVDAIRLSSPSETFFIAKSAPYYPVRVLSAQTASPVAPMNFALNFSQYDSAFAVPALKDYVDLSNPRTLPAHFVAVSGSIGRACGTGGCTLSALVRNDGGVGTGRAIFHAITPDGTEIARCASPIRNLEPGQSKTIACWVNPPSFLSYIATTSPARFTVDVQLIDAAAP